MDEKTEELIRDAMTKPRWISTANALMKLLDPKIIRLWGKKYIWWGDYHWRLYYSKTKNPYMAHVNYIVEYFKGKSGRLLDVGCGEGLIMKRIAEESNLECFGIDSSPLAIQLARQRKIFNCDAIPFERYNGHDFNFVLMGDLLEHLQDPEVALRKAKEWLIEQGTLLISIPLQEKKGMDDVHDLTPELTKKLIERVFVIESIDINRGFRKAYFTARKPEFVEKLPEFLEQKKLKTEKEELIKEEQNVQHTKEIGE